MILGNGTAGLNAAKAVRERDKTSSILMISEEKYPTYNRPMLTKALNAGLEISQIQVEPESWYEEFLAVFVSVYYQWTKRKKK